MCRGCCIVLHTAYCLAAGRRRRGKGRARGGWRHDLGVVTEGLFESSDTSVSLNCKLLTRSCKSPPSRSRRSGEKEFQLHMTNELLLRSLPLLVSQLWLLAAQRITIRCCTTGRRSPVRLRSTGAKERDCGPSVGRAKGGSKRARSWRQSNRVIVRFAARQRACHSSCGTQSLKGRGPQWSDILQQRHWTGHSSVGQRVSRAGGRAIGRSVGRGRGSWLRRSSGARQWCWGDADPSKPTAGRGQQGTVLKR